MAFLITMPTVLEKAYELDSKKITNFSIDANTRILTYNKEIVEKIDKEIISASLFSTVENSEKSDQANKVTALKLPPYFHQDFLSRIAEYLGNEPLHCLSKSCRATYHSLSLIP